MDADLHLSTLVDAMGPHPTTAAFLDAPTAFWVVTFCDLGIVVPAALVVGVGLRRGRRWARTCANAIVGGYLLIGWSVAGMAVTMALGGDPDASVGLVVGCTALAGALSIFAWFLYRPLLESATSSRQSGPAAAARVPRPPLTRR